ncbi:MAG TPA: pyridoxal-dependent decarboxylase, partial [Rhodopila sp.]|nr:pyridoxal-dependent decarboxylase [Rhodopila sp.]
MLRDALSHVTEGRVAPTQGADSIGYGLSQFDFRSAIPIEQLLDWTIEQLRNGIVQLTHPRYFGLFNPAPTFPSECADRIVAAFNPQLATSTTSPVAVAIERRLVQAIAQRAGLPDRSEGHFTSGGSEANF